MSENKVFLKASAILAAVLIVISVSFIALYAFSNLQVVNSVLLILAGIFILLTILIIFGAIYIINIKEKANNKKAFCFFYLFSKNIILPAVRPFSRIFKIDDRQLEKFFISINNKVLEADEKKYENKEIVLLLPHCLQDSSCAVNITHDINNCKRCGKCDISPLIGLSEKYGIKLIVVTGGTAARAQLSKIKPSAVVAVACERDLASGINDVKGIPVYGVLNMRPNGPCNNTKVDITKIEEKIKRLITK